jgi:hypothetical protein
MTETGVGEGWVTACLLKNALITRLLSCITKQASQKIAAIKIRPGRIAGEKEKPKLMASPAIVVKPASPKNSNEKARVGTARSKQSVVDL